MCRRYFSFIDGVILVALHLREVHKITLLQCVTPLIKFWRVLVSNLRQCALNKPNLSSGGALTLPFFHRLSHVELLKSIKSSLLYGIQSFKHLIQTEWLKFFYCRQLSLNKSVFSLLLQTQMEDRLCSCWAPLLGESSSVSWCFCLSLCSTCVSGETGALSLW